MLPTSEHAVLFVGVYCDADGAGAVVKLERCIECQRLKGILTEANRRVQTARIEMTQAAKTNAATASATTAFASSSGRESDLPVRWSFNQQVQAAVGTNTLTDRTHCSLQPVPSQEEFDTLKAESLAANTLLADHVDAEHPRAEVRV